MCENASRDAETQQKIAKIWQIHHYLNQESDELAPPRPSGHLHAVTVLPDPGGATDATIGEVLLGRRSCYLFGADPPTLSQISSLLFWAVGNQRNVHHQKTSSHRMSMAPSAGGLPSVEVCLVVLSRSSELTPGVYRYRRSGHVLVQLIDGCLRERLSSVYVQREFAERAPMTLVLSARMDTTLSKYPIRHYRSLHVDVGIVTQNIYLVATALGLAGCAVTGFHDNELHRLLGSAESEFPALLFPFGCPERQQSD